ncbi:MAG: prepilin-type N-terminal cleavage/methylation domain-containing protein [bacterium]
MTKYDKGFSLVESLIAVFILSVGIVAVLQAFPLGTYIQKTAQLSTTALAISQGKMEETISLPYSSILIGTNEEDYGSNSDFPSFRRLTEISYFDPENPEILPESDLGIKKIEITVFWKSHLGILEKEVKIATLITKK